MMRTFSTTSIIIISVALENHLTVITIKLRAKIRKEAEHKMIHRIKTRHHHPKMSGMFELAPL